MYWKRFKRAAVGVLSFTVLSLIAVSLVSCGHEQQLTAITIQPDIQTFGTADIPVALDAGLSVQLRAIGSYIHPPVTKDITNQVVWKSSDVQMVTVDATGMLTATGQTCGTTLVTATVTTNHSTGNIDSSGAIVTGTMTANVACNSSH